ncbi:MAG: hypothetical protein IJ943_03640 [Akkermansia sp.]|nr:hypothetical protein [Akkermansia sp.]MBR2683082.1 hypothetical protein [Atopobiaceae bacterium]MBR3387511.1 hypothetical protein [Bacteroidales bacterium]
MTDEQRKRIHDITYSTQDRMELAERIVELEDENAKLRDTTYAWRTVDRLSCENAKLRELVRGLHWCNDKQWNKGACDDCPIRGSAIGRCERAMRECGIEVDE